MSRCPSPQSLFTSRLLSACLSAAMLWLANPSAEAQVTYTANDTVRAYGGRFRPGVNLGYLPPWTPQQLADLAAGNPAVGVQGIGAKTTRPGLYDLVTHPYGVDISLKDYEHFRQIGLEELTTIVGFPAPEHRDWANRYCPTPEKWNAMFKGIYEPIWDDGTDGTPYNEDNTYAAYLYEVVNTYKDYVRFWEIWNEPALWKGDPNQSQKFWGGPEYPGSWWTNDPDPCDYYLHAPIEHYIRTIRISYEIIKTLAPDDYVCISGLGSASFLDAIMRNTDNPVDGSVTADYPLLGGAYFDVLGFHTYPHFDGSTKYGTSYLQRHSDGAADGMVDRALKAYQNVLYKYGYDGKTYPLKPHIATEVNVPRKQFTDQYFAGNEQQVNFIQKGFIRFKREDIYQMHVFTIGDRQLEADATFEFDLMGLYKKLDGIKAYEQQVNDEGIAYKTISDLLYTSDYDAAETARLQAPDGVRAYAFRTVDSGYVYALWAETRTDMSEFASATYSFPASLGLTSLKRYEWDYSKTKASVSTGTTGFALDATPIYLKAAQRVTSVSKRVAAANALFRFETTAFSASGQLILSFETQLANTSATLVDGLGRTLQQMPLAASPGIHRVELGLGVLPAGVYNLVVETPAGPVAARVVRW